MENKDWCDQNCNACAKAIFEKCSDRAYDLDSEEMYGQLSEEDELNIEEEEDDL